VAAAEMVTAAFGLERRFGEAVVWWLEGPAGLGSKKKKTGSMNRRRRLWCGLGRGRAAQPWTEHGLEARNSADVGGGQQGGGGYLPWQQRDGLRSRQRRLDGEQQQLGGGLSKERARAGQ
jgi:hypothetical protein